MNKLVCIPYKFNYHLHGEVHYYTCNSCNTGMRAVPDPALRQLGIHIRQSLNASCYS